MSIKKFLTNKFLRDLLINTIASAIPIVLLQFVIEPLMSRHMDDTVFGLMITIVSLFTMLSTIFGNTLNNVLLLKHNKIENEYKDYNILFIIFQVLNTIALILALVLIYRVYDIKTLLLVGLIGLSATFFSYCSAQFRMDFKYHLFLFCEIGKCVGYLLGYLLFRLTNDWVYVFLVGVLLESIICFICTRVWRYPYKISKYFKEISFATFFILGSSLTVSLVNYFDKLLIYPIMGGDSVSIYNSATIIAKGLSLITTPLGAVLLGYLVKKEFVTKKQLLFIIGVFSASIAPLFLVFYFASKLILPYMYPAFYQEAEKLLIYTTLFAIINIYISLSEPILLTHNGEKISFYYGIEKAALSIGFGFIGIYVGGLLWFCIFRLISTLLIIVSLYVMLFIRSKRKHSLEQIENNDEQEQNEIIDIQEQNIEDQK